MVASEASPGVRSSHRSRPGGAQRRWNDVRRCRAALAAVPSSPWPPRGRTSIPRRPESLSIRSKVLDSLLVAGGAAPQRLGLVRGSPAIRLRPGAPVLEGVVPAESCEPVDSNEERSRSSSPGRADGHSSSRWSRRWRAWCWLSREAVGWWPPLQCEPPVPS
jgi:hypothetical protein